MEEGRGTTDCIACLTSSHISLQSEANKWSVCLLERLTLRISYPTVLTAAVTTATHGADYRLAFYRSQLIKECTINENMGFVVD